MNAAAGALPDRPLLQLARAELHRAKQLRTCRVAAHGLTLIVGAVGLSMSGHGTYVISLLAVVTEAAAWTFRQQSRAHHQRAELGLRIAEARRFYDPATAVGADAEFRSEISRWACAHASEFRFDDTTYWDAAAGTGLDPLRLSLREAAFWSSRLYAEAARLAQLAAVVPVLLTVGLVFLFVLTDLDEAAQAVARLTALVIAALISADILTVRADWTRAASTSQTTYEALNTPLASEADLLRRYVDYRIVTAATEPIPGWIYDHRQDRLNVAWQANQPPSS
jgi:hypothetical protein